MKWLRGIKESSKSRSFNFRDESDWVYKLKLSHEHAWKTWKMFVSKEDMGAFPLQLGHGEVEQSPGVIPEAVIANLRPQIAQMPPKKK